MAKVKEETKVIEKPKASGNKIEIKRRRYNQGMAGTDVVTVVCPYCKKNHEHRISSLLVESLGTKTSHCIPGKPYGLSE